MGDAAGRPAPSDHGTPSHRSGCPSGPRDTHDFGAPAPSSDQAPRSGGLSCSDQDSDGPAGCGSSASGSPSSTEPACSARSDCGSDVSKVSSSSSGSSGSSSGSTRSNESRSRASTRAAIHNSSHCNSADVSCISSSNSSSSSSSSSHQYVGCSPDTTTTILVRSFSDRLGFDTGRNTFCGTPCGGKQLLGHACNPHAGLVQAAGVASGARLAAGCPTGSPEAPWLEPKGLPFVRLPSADDGARAAPAAAASASATTAPTASQPMVAWAFSEGGSAVSIGQAAAVALTTPSASSLSYGSVRRPASGQASAPPSAAPVTSLSGFTGEPTVGGSPANNTRNGGSPVGGCPGSQRPAAIPLAQPQECDRPLQRAVLHARPSSSTGAAVPAHALAAPPTSSAGAVARPGAGAGGSSPGSDATRPRSSGAQATQSAVGPTAAVVAARDAQAASARPQAQQQQGQHDQGRDSRGHGARSGVGYQRDAGSDLEDSGSCSDPDPGMGGSAAAGVNASGSPVGDAGRPADGGVDTSSRSGEVSSAASPTDGRTPGSPRRRRRRRRSKKRPNQDSGGGGSGRYDSGGQGVGSPRTRGIGGGGGSGGGSVTAASSRAQSPSRRLTTSSSSSSSSLRASSLRRSTAAVAAPTVLAAAGFSPFVGAAAGLGGVGRAERRSGSGGSGGHPTAGACVPLLYSSTGRTSLAGYDAAAPSGSAVALTGVPVTPLSLSRVQGGADLLAGPSLPPAAEGTHGSGPPAEVRGGLSSVLGRPPLSRQSPRDMALSQLAAQAAAGSAVAAGGSGPAAAAGGAAALKPSTPLSPLIRSSPGRLLDIPASPLHASLARGDDTGSCGPGGAAARTPGTGRSTITGCQAASTTPMLTTASPVASPAGLSSSGACPMTRGSLSAGALPSWSPSGIPPSSSSGHSVPALGASTILDPAVAALRFQSAGSGTASPDRGSAVSPSHPALRCPSLEPLLPALFNMHDASPGSSAPPSTQQQQQQRPHSCGTPRGDPLQTAPRGAPHPAAHLTRDGCQQQHLLAPTLRPPPSGWPAEAGAAGLNRLPSAVARCSTPLTPGSRPPVHLTPLPHPPLPPGQEEVGNGPHPHQPAIPLSACEGAEQGTGGSGLRSGPGSASRPGSALGLGFGSGGDGSGLASSLRLITTGAALAFAMPDAGAAVRTGDPCAAVAMGPASRVVAQLRADPSHSYAQALQGATAQPPRNPQPQTTTGRQSVTGNSSSRGSSTGSAAGSLPTRGSVPASAGAGGKKGDRGAAATLSLVVSSAATGWGGGGGGGGNGGTTRSSSAVAAGGGSAGPGSSSRSSRHASPARHTHAHQHAAGMSVTGVGNQQHMPHHNTHRQHYQHQQQQHSDGGGVAGSGGGNTLRGSAASPSRGRDASEEVRKAQERLEAYNRAQREKARAAEAEEAAKRQRHAEARNQQAALKERRRVEVYALNVLLARSEAARTQLLEAAMTAAAAERAAAAAAAKAAATAAAAADAAALGLVADAGQVGGGGGGEGDGQAGDQIGRNGGEKGGEAATPEEEEEDGEGGGDSDSDSGDEDEGGGQSAASSAAASAAAVAFLRHGV